MGVIQNSVNQMTSAVGAPMRLIGGVNTLKEKGKAYVEEQTKNAININADKQEAMRKEAQQRQVESIYNDMKMRLYSIKQKPGSNVDYNQEFEDVLTKYPQGFDKLDPDMQENLKSKLKDLRVQAGAYMKRLQGTRKNLTEDMKDSALDIQRGLKKSYSKNFKENIKNNNW